VQRKPLKRRKGLKSRSGASRDWIRARDAFLAENPRCAACDGPSEVVHHNDNRGVAYKNDDPATWIPMCHRDHQELHAVGKKTFWTRLGRGEGE
jgi:hypothetical protein